MADALPASVAVRTLDLGPVTLTMHILDDGRRVIQQDGMLAFMAAMEAGKLKSKDAIRAMTSETSREAVEREALECIHVLCVPRIAATLRALLSERDAATARAEGAERERADLRAGVDEWYEKAVRYISERDAARAERDRMKAALEEIAAGKFKCTWRQAHIAMQEVARAALGAASAGEAGNG